MPFIIAIIAVTVCGVGVVLGNRALIEEWFRSRSWKTTTARIVEDRDEEGWFLTSEYPKGGGARFDRFLAKSYFYRYEVEGHVYCSNRLGLGNEFITQKHFRIGEKVNVYYDPADPQNALLVRDFPISATFGLIIIGGAVLCLLWRALMT